MLTIMVNETGVGFNGYTDKCLRSNIVLLLVSSYAISSHWNWTLFKQHKKSFVDNTKAFV